MDTGAGGGRSEEKARTPPSQTIPSQSQVRAELTRVMSARRKRYEQEGDFGIPGLGDRNYRPGERKEGGDREGLHQSAPVT